jgi:hypothetical protein
MDNLSLHKSDPALALITNAGIFNPGFHGENLFSLRC